MRESPARCGRLGRSGRGVYLNIQILQVSAATDLSKDGKFYTICLHSLAMTAAVKELLKQVHVCQSYPKNNSGTVFCGLQCILAAEPKVIDQLLPTKLKDVKRLSVNR